MASLTKEAEDRIIELLLAEGLADATTVLGIKQQAEAEGKSPLTVLCERNIFNSDMVARATAVIINVPYVELRISPLIRKFSS